MLKKLRSLPEILWLLDLLLCSDLHTGSLLIESLLKSFSESGRVHRSLLLSPAGTTEQKGFLTQKVKSMAGTILHGHGFSKLQLKKKLKSFSSCCSDSMSLEITSSKGWLHLSLYP